MDSLADIAKRLKIRSIEMTDASNSGHPTTCCSVAEILAVLFFNEMRYDIKDHRNPNGDRLVLSKGHAAPILYAAYAEAGFFPIEELAQFRKVTCDLEGHPTPRLSFIDVATGSLGQGLGTAAGMAYLAKYIEKGDYRVYCIVGDGECSEGSIWEAVAFATYYKLDNLVLIVDANRLGQTRDTPLGHDLKTYADRFSSFGMHSVIVDGHSVTDLIRGFAEAKATTGKPTVLVAKTFKGHGITGIEDCNGFHGKALGNASAGARAEIESRMKDKNVSGKNFTARPPSDILSTRTLGKVSLSSPPSYELGQKVAPRFAYGKALVKLGESCDYITALDAEVSTSTFSVFFQEKFPQRYVECFIAEQNMVSVAIGLAARNRTIPFLSTFGAFLSRAYDQIRMGAVSMSNIKMCGSHVGVSIGEDGPSQMAMEDIAMFRAIPTCTVFYPSDAVSMEYAVELAANTPGMAYIRSSRPDNAVIYKCEEKFEVGKAKVVLSTPEPNLLMIGGGVTLHEILKAIDLLKGFDFKPVVMDLFTIKPIDREAILSKARACGGRIVTVEDHYIEGGIFEAVSSCLAEFSDVTVRGIAVREVPRSGKPSDLLEYYGISASKIAEQVKNMHF